MPPGGAKVLWVLLVLVKAAQPIIDWMANLNFIEPIFTVQGFRFGVAFLSILIAVLGGYVLGYFMTYFWNRLEK